MSIDEFDLSLNSCIRINKYCNSDHILTDHELNKMKMNKSFIYLKEKHKLKQNSHLTIMNKAH